VRKSIFEELNDLRPTKDKDSIVESRADHILSSAINLFEYMENNYTDEEFDQLQKRFISSIKGKDPKRFSRALYKIKKD
jgi:hypothetical protein